MHVGMGLMPAAGMLGEGCRGLAGMRQARVALDYLFLLLKAKTAPAWSPLPALRVALQMQLATVANEGAPRSFHKQVPALPEETQVLADGIMLMERVR